MDNFKHTGKDAPSNKHIAMQKLDSPHKHQNLSVAATPGEKEVMHKTNKRMK